MANTQKTAPDFPEPFHILSVLTVFVALELLAHFAVHKAGKFIGAAQGKLVFAQVVGGLFTKIQVEVVPVLAHFGDLGIGIQAGSLNAGKTEIVFEEGEHRGAVGHFAEHFADAVADLGGQVDDVVQAVTKHTQHHQQNPPLIVGNQADKQAQHADENVVHQVEASC